jgi:hypothetical protein
MPRSFKPVKVSSTNRLLSFLSAENPEVAINTIKTKMKNLVILSMSFLLQIFIFKNHIPEMRQSKIIDN